MSDDEQKSKNRSVQRLIGRRPSVTAWLLALLVFVDVLWVGDSLYWHLLGEPSEIQAWRRLPDFFYEKWWVNPEGEGSVDLLPLTLASSQASLLALWACLGRQRWPLRWSAAVAGIGYAAIVLAGLSASEYQPLQAEILFGAQAITIAVGMGVVRLCGWRLSAPASPVEITAASPRRMQFDVRDLIAGTTIVAALMWLLPHLHLKAAVRDLLRAFEYSGIAAEFGDPRPNLAWMAITGAASGALATIGAWLLLRPGKRWLRFALFGAAVWAIARILVLGFADFHIYALDQIGYYVNPGYAAGYAIWFYLQAALLLPALLAVRGTELALAQGPRAVETAGTQPRKSPRGRLRSALGYAAFSLLVLVALSIDEVVSRFAGDRQLRQSLAAINSGYGEHVAANCFWPTFDFSYKGLPSVGAVLTMPVDAAVIAKLRADHAPAGLWLNGGVDAATWNEVVRSTDLKLLCVTPDGRGAELTDDQLKQLTAVTGLWRLQLASSKITDKGLMHLAELENLEHIHLDCPHVTEQGEAEFLRASPRAGLQRMRDK